jgi:hypothetical protein
MQRRPARAQPSEQAERRRRRTAIRAHQRRRGLADYIGCGDEHRWVFADVHVRFVGPEGPLSERNVSHSGSGPAAWLRRTHAALPTSFRFRTSTRDETGSQSIPCSSQLTRHTSAESGISCPSKRNTPAAIGLPQSRACGSPSADAARTVRSVRSPFGPGIRRQTLAHRSARSRSRLLPAAGRPGWLSHAAATSAGTPALVKASAALSRSSTAFCLAVSLSARMSRTCSPVAASNPVTSRPKSLIALVSARAPTARPHRTACGPDRWSRHVGTPASRNASSASRSGTGRPTPMSWVYG